MRAVLLQAICFYQRLISPMMLPACRFQPTCSHYGHEAIVKHGVIKGILLTLRRLMRCQPWQGGGYDPVP